MHELSDSKVVYDVVQIYSPIQFAVHVQARIRVLLMKLLESFNVAAKGLALRVFTIVHDTGYQEAILRDAKLLADSYAIYLSIIVMIKINDVRDLVELDAGE